MSFKRSLLITTATLTMAFSTVFATDAVSDPMRVALQGGHYKTCPVDTTGPNNKAAIALTQMTLDTLDPWVARNAKDLSGLTLAGTRTSLELFRQSFGEGCSALATLNLRELMNIDGTPLELVVFLSEHAHSELLHRLKSGEMTLKFTAPSDAADDIRTKDESGKRGNAETPNFIYKEPYIQRLAQDILTLRAHQEQKAQTAALVTPTETRSDEEIAWDAIVSRRAPTQQVHDLKGAPSIAGDASSVLAARFTDSAVTLDEKFLPGAQQLRALVLSNSQATLTKGVKFGQDWVNLELLVLELQGLSNPMELFASASDTVLLRIAQKLLTVYMAEEALNTSPSFSPDTGDSSKAIRQMARAVLTQRGVDLNTSVATTSATASPSSSATHLATGGAPASRGWFGGIFGSSSSDAPATTSPAVAAAPANPNPTASASPSADNPTATATATEDDK